MENLRWILLLLGVVLVGVIYLIGRSRSRSKQSQLDAAREVDIDLDMPLSDDPVDDAPPIDDIAGDLAELNDLLVDSRTGRARAESATADESPASESEPEPEPEDTIIALHVVAPRGETFHGDDLVEMFERRGYRFGEHGIYHSVHQDQTVFSIANLVKPGWFEPAAMSGFHTPGISLFLRLPGPLAPVAALDVLFAEARVLADAFGGVIEDQDHSTLTQQTVQHLREQVQQIVHREAAGKKRQ